MTPLPLVGPDDLPLRLLDVVLVEGRPAVVLHLSVEAPQRLRLIVDFGGDTYEWRGDLCVCPCRPVTLSELGPYRPRYPEARPESPWALAWTRLQSRSPEAVRRPAATNLTET